MELQIAHLGKVSVTPEGEHNINRKYKKLSLVTVSDSEHIATFISIKFVPIGISILNTNYWMRLGFDPAVALRIQQQADWNQTNSNAVDYIKNKPTIPTVPTVRTFIVHLTFGENNSITSDTSIQDIIEKSASNNVIAVVASEGHDLILNLTYVDRSANFISFSVAIATYGFVGFMYILGSIENEIDEWRTDNPLELSHLINMPRIPTPTPEDAGKVLKVDEEGNYYLD